MVLFGFSKAARRDKRMHPLNGWTLVCKRPFVQDLGPTMPLRQALDWLSNKRSSRENRFDQMQGLVLGLFRAPALAIGL